MAQINSDDKKTKQDLMTRILGWGMIVYFLVLGYSINQSGLLELRTNEEQANVAAAKRSHANLIRERMSQHTAKINTSEKVSEGVKAAELDLEAKKLEDEISDGKSRAVGLLCAATTFLVFYLVLIYKFYHRYKPEMADYIVSRKTALFYAAFIGGSIWIIAVMTAFF